MFYDKSYTMRTKKPALTSLILLSDDSPTGLEKMGAMSKELRRNYDIRLKELNDGLYLIRLRKSVWGKPVSGNVIIDTGTKGCWIAYTDESGYFVKRVLEPFADELYPFVGRVSFNYSQVQKFLDAIKDTYNTVDIVTYVAYKRQALTEKGQPKGTHLVWETGAEEDVRKDARRNRIWIRDVSFKISDNEGIVEMQASLSTRGVARLRFGTFSSFQQNVVQLIIGLATQWKTFFSGRERKVEEGKVKLRPYQLQYQFDVEKPQIKELIANLSGSYSHSILVNGNPYFVTNLTDYKDGSSFYLSVLGKKVIITPMLRATPYALWKIATRVQHVAGEGEILDVPKELEM